MTRALRETRWRLLAIALVSAGLVAVLAFHLTIALVAAMLVYTGGRRLTEWMEHRTHLPHPSRHRAAVAGLSRGQAQARIPAQCAHLRQPHRNQGLRASGGDAFFEAIFGVAGLVMAPIVYAYAKAELRAAGWLSTP
jgi:predicted PurR-regulated permease PerM